MRKALLFRFGGFMADADAICLHGVDKLLDQPRACTVFCRPETGRFRGACSFLACGPGNPLVGAVIDKLAKPEPSALRKTEVSSGSRFLMCMINERSLGPDRICAEQKWGTSAFASRQRNGPSTGTVSGAGLPQRHKGLVDSLGTVAEVGDRVQGLCRQVIADNDFGDGRVSLSVCQLDRADD
jgi:hypothetical protein